MKYYIAVEIEATGPIADLTASLQRAFDGGAAGDFQVLVTRAPSYMVIFERKVADDAEYVSKRADAPNVSIERATMQQLAAELTEGDAGAGVQPVIDALNEGDAQTFDFGLGAFAAMAEYKPEAVLQKGQDTSLTKSKPKRVKSYRTKGVTHDGRPFDEVADFKQVQVNEVSASAIVDADGVSLDVAIALVKHWNASARLQSSGTVYSVHHDSNQSTEVLANAESTTA